MKVIEMQQNKSDLVQFVLSYFFRMFGCLFLMSKVWHFGVDTGFVTGIDTVLVLKMVLRLVLSLQCDILVSKWSGDQYQYHFGLENGPETQSRYSVPST